MTDKEKVFHPFGIALSFNEKAEDFKFVFESIKQAASVFGIQYEPTILIADSATAITKGFEEVFELTHRGICWAHATRGIDALLPKDGHEIKQEIDLIQVSPTPKIFLEALRLFEKKYSKSDKRMIDELNGWWFREPHNTWYEGYTIGLPSTSNAIESFHLNGIKSKSKLATRLPTGQFLNVMLDVMKNWSLDRSSHCLDDAGELVINPNQKSFNTRPKIANADYLAAYDWNKLNKQIRYIKSANAYFVKAQKPTQDSDYLITTAECKTYLLALNELQFTSLSELLDTVHSKYIIRMNLDVWELSECSCSLWLKHYKCSHVIAIAVRLKLASWNPIFLDLPLEKKNKKGAKKKSKSALLRQSIETVREIPRLIEASSDESTSEDEDLEPIAPIVVAKKRGRPPSGAVQSKKFKK